MQQPQLAFSRSRAPHNNTTFRISTSVDEFVDWDATVGSLAIMSFCSWNSEKYRDHFEAGIYVCPKCGHELFSAKAKYQHNTPWPAFTETIRNDSVSKQNEKEAQQSSKARALKVSCGKCGNGLGHEFLRDGPDGVTSRF